MKDRVDLELREDAIEQRASVIEPVNSRCTSLASAGSSGFRSSVTIELRPSLDELLDESVTNLAAGARDEHHRFPHHASCLARLPAEPVTSSGAAARRYTVNVAPWLRSLSTVTAPPMWRMMP